MYETLHNPIGVTNNIYGKLKQLQQLQQYVTGNDFLQPQSTGTFATPLLTETEELLNYASGGEQIYRYQDFFKVDKSHFCEGLLSMMFHIEMYNRLNLFLLTGEYLHLLYKPDAATAADKSEESYVAWVDFYAAELTNKHYDYEKLKDSLSSEKKQGPFFEISFDEEKYVRYFQYDDRLRIFAGLMDENIPEFLASIEEHYYLTQSESHASISVRRGFLRRFQEYEYPLHQLASLLYINLKISQEDHFLSADHTSLAKLVSYRYQLLKLMEISDTVRRSGENTPPLEREILPTEYKFKPIFRTNVLDEKKDKDKEDEKKDKNKEDEEDEMAEEGEMDVFGIFSELKNEEHAIRFYKKLNDLLLKKFTPIVQSLYEKVNFLIRKLLLRHGYRGVKDPRMMQLDDQRVPLVFLNRRIRSFSYEDYQLGYDLFKWEQRAKYNYTDTQAFVELNGYQLSEYRTLLNIPTKTCKSSVLPSIDAYHYSTRYFRDFEPSPEYLYKLYDSFKHHVYNRMRVRRNPIENAPFHGNLHEKIQVIGFSSKSTTEDGSKEFFPPDALNEHNWSAANHMCNYLYYSFLSLKLSGKYSLPPTLIEARALMTEVRLLQEETGIFSYFPYYKYARYLLKQIDLRIDEGDNKDLEDLYIQLRETITTCDNYFMLCRKKDFLPFHMPIDECYPYGKDDTIKDGKRTINSLRPWIKNVYKDKETGQWGEREDSMQLFVASTFVLPLNYEVISRRIDELKAEAESIALRQVTLLSEKNRNESKALKEDLFKTFGWFTGIVSFIVGGVFKMLGSQSGGVYSNLLFMAGFGLCLMLFLFALFGLTKGKSPLWDRLFLFVQEKTNYTIDGGRQTTITMVVRVAFWRFWNWFARINRSAYIWLKNSIDGKPNEPIGPIEWIEWIRWEFSFLKTPVYLGFIGLFIFGLIVLILRYVWTMLRFLFVLSIRVFNYISAGGILWRTLFFAGFFVVMILKLEQKSDMENEYRQSITKEVCKQVCDSLKKAAAEHKLP